MTNVLLPIYILAGMACFSFLVPADGGERMGFVITIFLGLIFSGIMIEQQAAQSGDNPSPKILNVVYYVYAIRLVEPKIDLLKFPYCIKLLFFNCCYLYDLW